MSHPTGYCSVQSIAVVPRWALNWIHQSISGFRKAIKTGRTSFAVVNHCGVNQLSVLPLCATSGRRAVKCTAEIWNIPRDGSRPRVRITLPEFEINYESDQIEKKESKILSQIGRENKILTYFEP